MALPAGVTGVTVNFSAGAFAADGGVGSGSVIVSAPTNVLHIPSGEPIWSGDRKLKYVNGVASFTLCPTDQPGLSSYGWTYTVYRQINGARVQPEPFSFIVAASGPSVIDGDALTPVPSSAGTPVSVQVLTVPGGGTSGQPLVYTGTGSGVGWGVPYETRLTVNVHDYGAEGDGTTDDTAAIQAAINAVQTAGGGTVTCPGTYRITAPLNITRAGVRLLGASRFGSVITQATPTAHGIVIAHDGGDGFTYMRGCTVERLRIEGTGGPTAGTPSSGVGIRAVGSGTSSPTYAGQHLALRDVTLSGWDTCVRVHRWDNCVSLAVGLEYSRIGYWSDGNANTHKLFGVAGTNCTETALRFGDGMGVEVSAEDIISCGRMLDLLESSQVTLHAYNFESCTGTTFVNVGIGAYLVAGGGRILKNIGADVPGFSVDYGAQLVQFGTPTFSGFTTATVIKKLDGNANIYVLGPTSNLSVIPEAMISEASASYPAGLWPTRIDNSVPGASVNLRNLLLGKMVRDTVADVDELFYYIRDRSTGADAYSQRSLSSVIRGTGSPAGVVAAQPGTLYLNKSGGAGQTLWVKETGTDASGWAAK